MPEYLGEAIVGAVFAVLGFLGKWLFDLARARRTEKHSQRSELLKLRDLLEESHSIFKSQNYQARRLRKLLRENHPHETEGIKGFDETFYQLHDVFNDEESELQSLIRSTTMHSLHRVNEELRSWLESNKHFLRRDDANKELDELAKQLRVLNDHLNQWFDKYEAWIPDDERRSLVYLGDEKKHGVPFPEDLMPALTAAIAGFA